MVALIALWPIPCFAQDGIGAPLPLGSSPRDRAVAEGLMNHYVVNTADGRFEAHGDAMLRRLRAELRAIDSVRQISRGEAFGGSLKDAVTGPFRGGEWIDYPPRRGPQGGIARARRPPRPGQGNLDQHPQHLRGQFG
ncbi:MAG: hypothetical protein HQ511_11705 [Rhodospirillales bacterium]|nr:hypothetical protein [Rhodospirillales bacterium]